MNESDYSRKLREALTDLGAKCIKLSDRFHASYPDLAGCYKGRGFVIEMKVHPNTLSDGQRFELDTWRTAGAACWVGVVNKKLKNFILENWATGERTTFPKIREAAPWLCEQIVLTRT